MTSPGRPDSVGRRFDPRSIVTPYAFSVHPDLLGRPLATPWQRLGAILVDLVIIGFISQIGLAPLAIGSAALLLWLAFREPGKEVFGKVFRIAVGCLGTLVLTVTVLVVILLRYSDGGQDRDGGAGADSQIETGELADRREAGEPGEGALGIGDLVRGARGALALQSADTREEAQALMNDLARGAFDADLPRSEIRDLLGGIVPKEAPWAPQAESMVNDAIGNLGGGEAETGEDPAAESEEEAGPDELSVALSPTAMDSIVSLNRAIRLAEEDRADAEAALERTEQALEAERNQGTFNWFREIIDDLGIGSLWAALYLTITHAWWRGTTVGKKLFRIRVVMIDKRPLNWWLSFERVGGYAAGFATGLLGFAQIFWDPNRQAIHDKVSETIVIQDGQAPVPGPWIEEGTAQWQRARHRAQETPGA